MDTLDLSMFPSIETLIVRGDVAARHGAGNDGLDTPFWKKTW